MSLFRRQAFRHPCSACEAHGSVYPHGGQHQVEYAPPSRTEPPPLPPLPDGTRSWPPRERNTMTPGTSQPGDTLAIPWYARPNDLIGGWCVMPADVPPSSGLHEVADFCNEQVARHVAELHNNALRVAGRGTPDGDTR